MVNFSHQPWTGSRGTVREADNCWRSRGSIGRELSKLGDVPFGVASDVASFTDQLTEDQRRLLRGYNAASPKMKKAFLRFADMVAIAMIMHSVALYWKIWATP